MTDPMSATPAAPGDFGSRMRDVREQRHISLRQIADTTKISMGVLEALERNDISRLPGGIFSRAFVRSYAAHIGVDPERTVREFIAEFPHESVTAGSPHLFVEQISRDRGRLDVRALMIASTLVLVVIALIAWTLN